MIKISVIICAYNEEKNIGKLIDQMLDQSIKANEIIVVSSGSTDSTNNILSSFSKKHKEIKLLRQTQRKGKVRAVNLGLNHVKSDIIILCSADVQLEKNTFEKLVEKFNNEKIGMVGAHPVPVNDPKTFAGFYSHLIWALHHDIALKIPKCGEVIAFRNLGYLIPEDVPIDEAYLEFKFKKEGFLLAYAPGAIVHNHGPKTIADMFVQRRRIHAQHMFLKQKFKYVVSTSTPSFVFSALMSTFKPSFEYIFFLPIAVVLETISILFASYDFFINKNAHKVWKIARSTKVVR
ncbi:MAG: glycosyltransferase [Candidatus Micrarchaeota archaeon]